MLGLKALTAPSLTLQYGFKEKRVCGTDKKVVYRLHLEDRALEVSLAAERDVSNILKR